MALLGFMCMLVFQQVVGDSPALLVSQASNEFTLKAFEVLSKESGNLLFSPLTLHVALGLLHQGAGGRTAQELATVLGLTSANSQIKEGYKTLLTGIEGDVLKIVTKLYPNSGYHLNDNYIKLAQDVFQSNVETLNYSDPTTAANKINKYVKENSNNKIINLINQKAINSYTRLIIINAINFDAIWKTSFHAAYESQFRLSPSENKPVKMMAISGYFNYKEDSALDAKVLKIEYERGDYNMIVILPKEDDSNSSYSLLLNLMEANISTNGYESLFTGYQNKSVYVRIPKFKIETSLSLKVYLQKLGINQVFTEEADLHGIANGDKLFVNEVIQKIFIDVHEEGTESDAPTGIQVNVNTVSRNNPMPEIFIADRPFLFFIVKENFFNTILFAGRYQNPIYDSI